MPAAKANKPNVSNQSRLSTSKLIQNLGSNTEQYKFQGELRTAWGRD
tara:strand:- start:251 stop:391 length:141 start_codon:yes stop_codon:yes gene_type:complete